MKDGGNFSDEELKLSAYEFLAKKTLKVWCLAVIDLICIVLYAIAYRDFKAIRYDIDVDHLNYLSKILAASTIGAIAICLSVWLIVLVVHNIDKIKVTLQGKGGMDGYVVKVAKIKIVDLYRNYYCKMLLAQGKLAKTYDVCYVKYIEYQQGKKFALDISKEEFDSEEDTGSTKECTHDESERKEPKNKESIQLMEEFMSRQKYADEIEETEEGIEKNGED